MNMNRNELSSQTVIKASKKAIDRSVRALMQEMEHETTLAEESPVTRLQKVLKIYRGIKPLFTIIGTLPLIPSTWRAAIVMFDQSLDALSAVGGEITASFKAGRDL